MLKTWLIIKREYITRVRKKSFLLLTFLTPLGFGLLMVVPLFLAGIDLKDQRILVRDESNMFDALPDSEGIFLKFASDTSQLDQLIEQYQGMGYDALLHIPSIDPDAPRGIKIYAPKQIGITTKEYIKKVIADRIEQTNLEAFNLDRSKLRELRPDINISDAVVSEGKEREGNAAIASAIGYIMGFSIYIVLLIYGTMVMRGVMEEKTNRIVEVIVSSVKPVQLMLGKIIGIGAVGLTQLILWGVLISVIQLFVAAIFSDQLLELQDIASSNTLQTGNEMAEMAKAYTAIQNIDFLPIILSFIFYFIGGYLLYSALFAAIGSLVDEDSGDIQMYTIPVTIPIIISIFIMFTVVQEPDSQLAIWGSLIPFSSPIVMPARIPFEVPGWQLLLSGIFLILGFLFTTWLAAKIYRTGILMYGKKIKFRELIRWLRY